MVDVFVILPDQLFYTNEALGIILNDNISHVYMFEDPLYFTKWKSHASKLALHRASMQRYYKMLSKITNVHYIQLTNISTNWIDYLEKKVSPTSVEMFYPSSIDEWGTKIYKVSFTGLPIKFHETPAFLLEYKYIHELYKSRNKMTFNIFYKQVRKDFFIQLNPRDVKGKYQPLGGQWIYGENAHKPIPTGTEVPILPTLPNNEEFKHTCEYVKNIPTNGDVQRYPIDGKEALEWFSHFIKNKLMGYGGRQLTCIIGAENSITNDISKTLFHSVMSTSMNIGIITPKQILTELFLAFKHNDGKMPMASFEGFFRQIIWREYTRMIYTTAPVRLLELPNYFNANCSAGDVWYKGTTQMEPVDMIIKDVLANGYAHNTQRLYWVGAYMMMQQIHPIDIRNWFLGMFADAYPWSVIPHILLMHGSPEFGGSLPLRMSNFLINTSNLGKNKNVLWYNKWDLLYYLFMGRNASKLSRDNSKLLKQWKAKPLAERKKILTTAKSVLIDKSAIMTNQTLKSDVKPKPQSNVKTNVKFDTKPKPQSNVKPIVKSKSQSNVKSDTKPKPQSGVKPIVKSKPQSNVKPIVKSK